MSLSATARKKDEDQPRTHLIKTTVWMIIEATKEGEKYAWRDHIISEKIQVLKGEKEYKWIGDNGNLLGNRLLLWEIM